MATNLSRRRRACAAAALLAWSAVAWAETRLAARDLADLSLEQLANIVVSSVSRRDEPLTRAAASVYVISGEDIRRSAATSLPEALRLAPNLDVARADANQYAISARGFNNVLANRMLVLIDGRTVYTPLFSGTFWEAQDLMLEDIERIEVISGPGAALWGANAVNGVINVITRAAADTRGELLSAQAGTAQKDGAARYGGRLGDARYRVYGKGVRRDHTSMANGNPVADAAEHAQAGFRADLGGPRDRLTVQGDAYAGEISGQGREFAGLNLLGRWSRELGSGAELAMQAYFDRTSRHHTAPAAGFVEHLDTYDFELQHALAPAGGHRVLWGFGLRHHRDEVKNSLVIRFLPPNRTLDRNHVFVQDEIALRGDLDLTLGAKVESNSYTGAEVLPSARLGWRPSAEQLVWAALSRAVRAPSRVDRELFSPGVLAGGAGFVSEVSKVFELGYRGQPTPRLSYSVTGFYHDHDKLRSIAPSPADPVIANDREGHTRGIEGWGSWRAAQWWRFSAGFVRLKHHLRDRPGAVNLLAPASEQNDPRGWVKLRASFDLSAKSELDVMLRHVGSRPDPGVPAYTAVDLRYGWRPARGVELSAAVQNLFDRRHPEWGAAANRAELERAAFLRLRLEL